MTFTNRASLLGVILGCSLLVACSGPNKGAPRDGGGLDTAGGRDGGAGTGATTGTGGMTGTGSTTGTGGGISGGGGTSVGGSSGGTVGTTQCSDGRDNDGDGKIDLLDPECVSPLDNDESSFATGIPGDNMDACRQDCFFDGNSGMGDDGCELQLKCDPANAGVGAANSCPYDSTYKNCPTTQSAKCVQNCGAATPNGCDCFGCCVVPGVSHPVRLEATCTAASFADPTKCPACTQQTSCIKTCGACQLCLGKTVLEPGCTPTGTDGGTGADGGTGTDGGTGIPVCPNGQVVCGTNPGLCGNNTLCVTGCCVPWIF